ncbi:hypothetical protein NYR55_13900 [Sphingomonas sp. BGYR3]|uniref:hypothetical protein n=1 Tax=Sphingomonas sp. BGYR3 TaxID=2975483 RepID=UPI0021A4AFD7|nr:hypothetical protein [Sphingomonas sp. BGYR3]MDG5489713.1 hypothetical protein [Sphingomonas sp. BGYR3]
MTFEVKQTSEGWAGVWERPKTFQSDGEKFFDVSGPVVSHETLEVKIEGDTCELTFNEGGSPFVLHVLDADRAELRHPAFQSEPAILERTTGQIALGPWDPNATYRRIFARPNNPEMAAIFEADQAARRFKAGQNVDWAALAIADRERRHRVQQLLDSGELRSGQDFHYAAFVFQHGDQATDYLKAHALAVIAVARGESQAVWIAAATLDRYLQNIGQPQIYGTQFSKRGDSWTQEPYQRDVLSDALRRASRVPDLAGQQKQLENYEQRGIR